MPGSWLWLVGGLSSVPRYETRDDRILAGGGNDKACGRSRGQPDDGTPDVLDCGQGTDMVHFAPGVDEVSDHCEFENPTEWRK